MRKRTLLVITVLAVLAALSACGDDESVFEGGATSAGESTTTAAPTTSTAEESTTTTEGSTTTSGGGVAGNALGGLVTGAISQGMGAGASSTGAEEEECLITGLEAAIGAERFAELDALAATAEMPEVFAQMSDEELDALIAVIGDCIDMEALFTAEMAGQGLSPEAVACFAGTFSQEETLHSLIRASMTGEDPTTNPEFIALMVQVMTGDCSDEMEAMLVDEFVAGGMSEASAACVADEFLQGGLFESLLNTILGGTDFPTDPELQALMMAAFTQCLTPDELANLGG